MQTEDATFEALQLRVVIDERGTKRYYNHDNQLHRKFGPAIECTTGEKHWYINDKLHNENGHAIEYASGTKRWYINSNRHRTDGPAIVYYDGSEMWYINGIDLTEQEFLAHPLCTIK